MKHRVVYLCINAIVFFNATAMAQSISTKLALISWTNPAPTNSTITFYATLTTDPKATPAGALPTGTITFYDGNNTLGDAVLNGSSVTLTNMSQVSFDAILSEGTHTITAVYSGDANFQPSKSAPWQQVITSSILGFGTYDTRLTCMEGESTGFFWTQTTFTCKDQNRNKYDVEINTYGISLFVTVGYTGYFIGCTAQPADVKGSYYGGAIRAAVGVGGGVMVVHGSPGGCDIYLLQAASGGGSASYVTMSIQ